MNAERVEQIVRFALAAAAREDDAWSRELGAIHLLKYVYLADLAFAERNGGASFTGVDWQFFNYGPWSPAVHTQVLSVVAAVGAIERIFSSPKFEKDSVRWHLDADDAEQIYRDADRALPSVVTSTVRRAVRSFGNDTTSLLHHVYGTRPMLRAAPQEGLSFAGLPAPAQPNAPAAQPALSVRAQKKEKERFEEAQARARAKLEEVRAKRAQRSRTPAPRYDDVFVAGQKWLDNLAGEPLEALSGEVEFSSEVWKDPWRTEPDAA